MCERPNLSNLVLWRRWTLMGLYSELDPWVERVLPEEWEIYIFWHCLKGEKMGSKVAPWPQQRRLVRGAIGLESRLFDFKCRASSRAPILPLFKPASWDVLPTLSIDCLSGLWFLSFVLVAALRTAARWSAVGSCFPFLPACLPLTVPCRKPPALMRTLKWWSGWQRL